MVTVERDAVPKADVLGFQALLGAHPDAVGTVEECRRMKSRPLVTWSAQGAVMAAESNQALMADVPGFQAIPETSHLGPQVSALHNQVSAAESRRRLPLGRVTAWLMTA